MEQCVYMDEGRMGDFTVHKKALRLRLIYLFRFLDYPGVNHVSSNKGFLAFDVI